MLYGWKGTDDVDRDDWEQYIQSSSWWTLTLGGKRRRERREQAELQQQRPQGRADPTHQSIGHPRPMGVASRG